MTSVVADCKRLEPERSTFDLSSPIRPALTGPGALQSFGPQQALVTVLLSVGRASSQVGHVHGTGYVFADVGRATHYHTDWIVPYWRYSLTKVARVGSHLFYVRG